MEEAAMKTTNKILPGHRYVGNFLDAPVRIGMIYRMDDRQFIPALHFNDSYPEIDLAKWTDSGSKGTLRFTGARDVAISFGTSTSTALGKSEIRLSFRRQKTVAGAIEDAAIDSLRYGNVLPQLKEIWNTRGYAKFPRDYIFVYEVLSAASGTLVYSLESKNEVILRHTLGEPVTKLADLASGNFEYVSNSRRTLEIIRNVAHKPLFKAFMFRRDWEPEILG
jgi:hypothetical protein